MPGRLKRAARRKKKLKKHSCPDCKQCAWCADARCEVCRGWCTRKSRRKSR